MSFSKAKINRFNDVQPSAPSPAAYNVTVTKGIKCTNSAKTECQNTEPKTSASDSEAGSTHSTPCFFRNPSLPRRKRITSALQAKAKEIFGDSKQTEALKERIVECVNKDACIKDLSEQLEEVKNKLCQLEKQKAQLGSEKRKFEDTLNNLKNVYDENLKKLQINFDKDLQLKNEEKSKLAEEISRLKSEYQELQETNKVKISKLEEDCSKFKELQKQHEKVFDSLIAEKNSLLKSQEGKLAQLERKCQEIEKTYQTEMENLKKAHQAELQNIEFEMLKTMTELQKEKDNAASQILDIKEAMCIESQKAMELLKEKEKLEEWNELTIKNLEEKHKKLTELKEKENKEKFDANDKEWKNKLEMCEKQFESVLKECQLISEYNIIQCEVEKHQAESQLEKKTEELKNVRVKYEESLIKYEEVQRQFKDLQGEFDRISSELNEYKSYYALNLDGKSKIFADQKRTYQLTIKNLQATIEVLTKRLINSDRDVEQLKAELAESESKILEFESKCQQLALDLKQSYNFNEDLEMQFESQIKLNTTEILKIKNHLAQKVDNYKDEVKEFKLKFEEEKKINLGILDQLREAFDVINEMTSHVDCFEHVNSDQEFEIEQSRNELEDYHIRELDWNVGKEKLENTIKCLEEKLDKKHEEIDRLRKVISQLEEKNNCCGQYLEFYKNKAFELEMELEEAGSIHKKYVEQSGRYDELLQKFEQLEADRLQSESRWKNKCNVQSQSYEELLKKFEEVKCENLTNKKKLEELSTEKSSQSEIIGKFNEEPVKLLKQNTILKKENEDLKKENGELKKCLKKTKVRKEDKENIGSPNRSLNSSRIESPFRDRN